MVVCASEDRTFDFIFLKNHFSLNLGNDVWLAATELAREVLECADTPRSRSDRFLSQSTYPPIKARQGQSL